MTPKMFAIAGLGLTLLFADADTANAAEILSEQGIDFNTARVELGKQTAGMTRTSKTGSVDELLMLAADVRSLATAMIRKAERIESLCGELAQSSSDDENNNK